MSLNMADKMTIRELEEKPDGLKTPRIYLPSRMNLSRPLNGFKVSYLTTQANRGNKALTFTVSIDGLTSTTKKAISQFLDKRSIKHTIRESSSPKLALEIRTKEQAVSVLNKLYGLGAFGAAFDLHGNLLKKGVSLGGYRFNNIATPKINKGNFTVARVEFKPNHRANNISHPAVHYHIKLYNRSVRIEIPLDHRDHLKTLSEIRESLELYSPKA